MNQIEQSNDEPVKAWLAGFSAALDVDSTWTAEQLREKIRLVEELQQTSRVLNPDLVHDALLAGAYRDALRHLAYLEAELRQRMGKLAPGDRDSHVDLDTLREQLAELQARKEVGAPALPQESQILLTSQSNWLPAVLTLAASLSAAPFIVFHAISSREIMGFFHGGFMIAFLPLYGMSLVVLALMAALALRQASTEVVEVEKMTVRRTLRLLGMEWTKAVTFQHPVMVEIETQFTTNRNPVLKSTVTITDSFGQKVQVGETATQSQREALRERLIAHFAMMRSPRAMP